MHFSVEEDTGDRISGYLVPDSFTGVPRFRLWAAGRELGVYETTELRELLVSYGRHETGRCGFVLDESLVPGLPDLVDLEISDADSGLLIYRRAFPDQYVTMRLLRLETHMLALTHLDNALKRRFRHPYCRVERIGLETARQLFCLLNDDVSTYIAGRLMFKNFEYSLDSGFQIVCMIHDPFEELAERLFMLRQQAKRGRALLDARESLLAKPVLGFVSQLRLDDERSLRRAFKKLDPEVARFFLSPLARQLTTGNAHDLPRSSCIPSALDILSQCAVVGLRTESEAFSEAMEALLSLEPNSIPIAGRCTGAIALAERLRSISSLHDLLELDLELYSTVAIAFDKATEDVEQLALAAEYALSEAAQAGASVEPEPEPEPEPALPDLDEPLAVLDADWVEEGDASVSEGDASDSSAPDSGDGGGDGGEGGSGGDD